MENESRLELIRHGRQMRLVRWLMVPFTLAQFVLYRAPEGTTIPFDPQVMSYVVATPVVAINLLSMYSERLESEKQLRWLGRFEMFADTALVLWVIWLFSFDSVSALWALLVLPILEGAIRASVRGALFTWALSASGYIAREVAAEAPIEIESITYRMGIMLVVALATGSLARTIEERARDHYEARKESDRRAELLRTVARASRNMISLDSDDVFSTVAEAGLELGYDSATVVVLDEETDTHQLRSPRGLVSKLPQKDWDATMGVVGQVRRTGETVIIADYSTWDEALPDVAALGLVSLAGCPIWVDATLEAVIVVGYATRHEFTTSEVEALELLAARAGADLTTARHLNARQALQQQLTHESYHDSLTGLANRTLFLDRLDHCLERKASTPTPTAVIFIDLDRFTHVNESFGAEAGDELIQLVTDRLNELRAPGDTIARLGGVQFAMLLEEPVSQSSVMDVGAKIVNRLQEPFDVAGTPVFITSSVGVSFRYQTEGLARDFMREADLAVNRAREQGGNRCEAYRPIMSTRAKHRMELERELRQALLKSELVVYYQPAVSIKTNSVVGIEALIRWQHPERGLVTAGEFMPLAEETGLVNRLGRHVLEEVTAQIAVWRAKGTLPAIPVSMNLSAPEFGQPEFVDHVVSALDSHKLHPNDLIFEVTENVVMRDDPATLAQMRSLNRIGIRLAIDDFGRGYSSLSYLKRFRFSVLKIDRSFVTDLATKETDQAIIRYVIGLSNDLRIPAVAEGVETSEQLEFLRSLGCEYVQGFFVCPPLSAMDLADYLERSKEGIQLPRHEEDTGVGLPT